MGKKKKQDRRSFVEWARGTTKTKVSTFTAWASGDCECFCFDTRDADAPWDLEADASRIYPYDLLPKETHHRHGQWRITVEFTPLDPAPRSGAQSRLADKPTS